MVKHSGQRNRGIRRSVQRHSIRVGDAAKADGMQSFIFSKQLQQMVPLARDQWSFLRRVCSKCSFIPVAVDHETGRAALITKWKRFIHYLLAMMYSAIMSYKLYITIHRVAEGKLDLVTYMCACSFIVLFNGACATVGSTWLPGRMCNLFNSWKSMQEIVDMKTGQREKTVFDDKAVSIKILFLVVIIHLAAINASMFSFVGEVPACVLPTLKRMGWLDLPDSIPPMVWSLVFFPLELFTLWPPMLATGVCAISFVLGLGMFQLFSNEIRKESVLNMKSWSKVYHQYRIMQVYNAILMDWMKNVLMAALFSSSCGVILLLYVTIRPSDLPFLVYVWFPIVAVLLMITTTWIVYDAVLIKRTVEEVVGNLESGLAQRSFMKIDARRHAGMIRMLKSLRPAALALGEFSEASLLVPMNIWDEVLNQLVFLLSLASCGQILVLHILARPSGLPLYSYRCGCLLLLSYVSTTGVIYAAVMFKRAVTEVVDNLPSSFTPSGKLVWWNQANPNSYAQFRASNDGELSQWETLRKFLLRSL